MKFLIHSNGPNVSTGYGVQTAHLITRLQNDGHKVAVSCTYGQQGAVGQWRGIRLYPVGYEVNGNDVLHLHAAHFFSEGETARPGVERSGWIIPLLDVWCLVNPLLHEFNMAAWTPVDHFPVPPNVRKFFLRNPECVPIAMSRFGEAQLFAAGLNPAYIPLSVDTTAMHPTEFVDSADGPVACRKLFGIPDGAFVVGMVAMNKGWSRDRKGFNEAFHAFGEFYRNHPDAVLFMHAEKFGGAEGINLVELAEAAGIPEHVIIWSDQYAYRLGLPANMMAAAYTCMDVLLAPSHGEGFCVPLVEAQACGTPVIATGFSSQAELVGAGWQVGSQWEWDPTQHAQYRVPFIHEVVHALEQCYELDTETRAKMSREAYDFAKNYDTDHVYATYWRPFIARLETLGNAEPVELSEPRAPMRAVDVLVPCVRAANEDRLVTSLLSTSPEGVDVRSYQGDASKTYAENVNALYAQSHADWVLVVGDDVEFKPGWFEAAQALSDRYDVIGTNDTDGKVRNPDVAAGRHADHFFIRRAYVDELGASLDGPGVVASESYGHWFTDKEIVELAKARRVWTPCLESVIVHHHPGYDGNEPARVADPLYSIAVDRAAADRDTFLSRLPLIQMQRG